MTSMSTIGFETNMGGGLGLWDSQKSLGYPMRYSLTQTKWVLKALVWTLPIEDLIFNNFKKILAPCNWSNKFSRKVKGLPNRYHNSLEPSMINPQSCDSCSTYRSYALANILILNIVVSPFVKYQVNFASLIQHSHNLNNPMFI